MIDNIYYWHRIVRTLYNLLPLFGIVNAAPIHAQLLTATIKLSTGTSSSVSMLPRELIVKNISLRNMIRMAYHVRDFQITGGPAWIDSDRYDMEVKMGSDWTIESREQMLGPILQQLLKEKFKLNVRRETKELPVYSLTISKYGHRLPPSKAHCTNFQWGRYAIPPGKQPPDYCGAVEAGPNLRLNHTLDAVGMKTSDLTTLLSRELDRDVIDKTGLTGLFDVHLEWNREATARSIGPEGRVDPSKLAPSTDDESPSIFTAIEDQLGLKIDSIRGPVQIIVIDRVEKPAAN
jgi:uncharacterized protein (TIGR03435 family)